MFTRSIVIQRRVEDLQLGVESYQNKLNLTKPDTYRSDLKRTAYSSPRGFIYQNKDKKNKLMRIDELQKISDGTLDDVRTALDDCLKGIRMKYLPQAIWRQSDRDKAGAMIQVDPHGFKGIYRDGHGGLRKPAFVCNTVDTYKEMRVRRKDTIGDENPIRTLGDYSKPSHEGYRNTIELPIWNNMVPLRSDTIRLVQNRFSFHELRSEYPNQHLKDFLKLVALLDLDGENRERNRLHLFQFSLRYQASNWLERLLAGSITTWEDLTTRFLAQFFPPGRTVKLRNDILMFQQNHGESLSEAWTRFKDLLQKFPQHGIDLWLQLRDLNAEESWALLEDLALYDNESWNDPRDFAKSVKEIALPQDVLSTSNHHLIEQNQVQRLMEAYLAPTQPTQVNKITTSCEICSGPHDTQYCMKIPNKPLLNTHPRVPMKREVSDARLSKFEADFKQQQSEMTNKINTVLKAITDRIAGTLPSDTVKNPKLGTHPVLSTRSYPTINPQCSSHPSTSINAIKAHFNKAIISQTSMQQPVVEIKPQQPEEPKPTLEDEFKDLHLNLPVLEVLAHAPIYNAILDKYVESLELDKNGSAFVQGEVPTKMEDPGLFTLPCGLGDSKNFETLANLGSYVNIILLYLFKKLNIGLLEETGHIFGLADGTKSYPVGIVKDVEVHIGKLKLLNDFYVIDMKKDPETPLLVGRGFLATTNAVIDCRMAKIVVGEGITSSDEIGAQTPYYARKDFLGCHLPREWEISRDAKLNPFKDTLVFRRMVEFLGAIPINLKCNMWESEDLIKKPINWDKPPKNKDEAWHAKIRLIDLDGEEFTKTLQSIPTTRKLSKRESPREIIDFDHFYDT
ncbi:MAK10-like protein [Tanacetum coccineum]